MPSLAGMSEDDEANDLLLGIIDSCRVIQAEVVRLRNEVSLWKDRYEAEKQAHAATMHHADETFREMQSGRF